MILARQFHRRPNQANCHRCCTAHAATSGTTRVKLFNPSSNNTRRRVKSELNFATAPRGNEKNGRTTFVVSTKRRLTLSDLVARAPPISYILQKRVPLSSRWSSPISPKSAFISRVVATTRGAQFRTQNSCV